MGRVTAKRMDTGVRILSAGMVLSLLGATLGCEANPLREHIMRNTAFEETGFVLYVHPQGSDTELGTPEEPFRTINKAIRTFSEEGVSGEVRVAAGTYEVNYHEGTHVKLRKGVSLFGGYSSDFSERNPSEFETVIRDISSGPYREEHPRAVEAGKGITSETIIAGFTIVGGTGQSAVGLWIEDGSPFVETCVIRGGAPSAPEDGEWSWACGVYCVGSGARFYQCDISGSTDPAARFSTGVSITGSESSALAECIIDGGAATEVVEAVTVGNGSQLWLGDSRITASGASETTGVLLDDSSVTLERNRVQVGGENSDKCTGVVVNGEYGNITNNVISCGECGEESCGVSIGPGTYSDIIGNEIAGGGGSKSVGVHITTGTEWSFLLQGNYIDGGRGTTRSTSVVVGSSDGVIRNNVIHGGSSDSDETVGIELMEGLVYVENNTIYGGSGSGWSCALRVDGSKPEAMNNILWTGGSGDKWAVGCESEYEGAIDHNLFF
ncbi:MAG: right-handed parallel beta-helix repeat-containing protein, partial [Alkalispirochaetaceae bacterium]